MYHSLSEHGEKVLHVNARGSKGFMGNSNLVTGRTSAVSVAAERC